MNFNPSEEDIQKVMKDTGMDYMQAYRHARQRMRLQADLERNRNPFPLGKSQHFA